MNKIKKVKVIFMLMLMIATMTACGKTVSVSEEESPELINAEITSYNEGTEEQQYVKVDLIFDKEIKIADSLNDTLRITIAGNRVKEDEYTLEQGEDETTASLTISVEAVTDGIVKIQKSEKADTISDILDASGQYAVKDFTLEGTTPSGVTLSTVESDAGKVVKQVDTPWNIRSIAWVGLTENGELVPVAEESEDEMLDGYAAVHGHEFLMDNESTIAENIVETLENNYDSEYRFSCDGNQITVEKSGQEVSLDIDIYQYLNINGESVTTDTEDGTETDGEESSGESLKTKQLDEDREVTEEEQDFLNNLYIYNLSEDGITDGTFMYSTFTLTGDAMSEEEIYSVRDLETLIEASYTNTKMNALGLVVREEAYYGIDFQKFLELCNADLEQDDVSILCETADGNTVVYSYDELQSGEMTLALGDEDGPYREKDGSEDGPIDLIISGNGETEKLENVEKVIVGTGDSPEDPEYRYHNREPFSDSKDITFTVETYQEGAEYLGALTTVSFTTEDLENMMEENPEEVVCNYYGTIGNEEIYPYAGVGGWLDCFEGIDLYWLLTEKAGVDNLNGYAELVGRDGEVYGTIDDLSYLDVGDNASEYYTLTSDGVKIPNAVPMIACVKNSYPILKEHDHESSGYIAYNQLNQSLEDAGISIETGVVKNHNGPFIACLGNLDGYYGGDQVETGGDCVLLRLYIQ